METFLFEPEAAMAGDVRVSKALTTYWNRIKLKSRFKKAVDAAVTRERTFTAGEETKPCGIAEDVSVRPFMRHSAGENPIWKEEI